MLKIIIGKAGTGKTTAVIEEIKQNMRKGLGGNMLIVPEQYSHEAERELCRACGDSLSLYAEVLSFTGLARRVAARQGGTAAPWLDKGGRLLCMSLALQSVGSRLKVYSAARRKAELQSLLLSAVDELKAACIGSEELNAAALECSDGLGDKLSDLALILEAYDAVVSNGRADPADRLTLLASQIENGDMDSRSRVYVDGFIDFTHQEYEILRAMLHRGVNLTVCLTVDSMTGENEIFELSRRAGRALINCARELGQDAEIVRMEGGEGKQDALRFFADNMFSYSDAVWGGEDAPIRLYRTESMAAECEQAAALCLELVREKGCRWRDIAVAVRGFEDYRATLESVFRHYAVPLFTAGKSDMMSRPLPAMIECAYEIVQGGWAVDDMISYLRTGLAGLSEAECDELESYIFKWQIRGSAWQRRGNWRQHPDGYGNEYTEETEEKLRRINDLRRRVAKPLTEFAKAAGEAETASSQAKALAALFAALKLPETLSRRAEELTALGREKTAAEYRQLWDITVSALEQCDAILGDTALDSEEFSRLFRMMLSRYDIGTIPVSLDRVSAGDFDRNRRRNIKHLIVLGASEQRLPRAEEDSGVFSQDERRRLTEMELEIDPGGEGELWREFSLIYNCLTMPSESLTMLCPVADNNGAELRPAFVFNRAAALFGLQVHPADLTDARMSSPESVLGLAAQALRGGGVREQAAYCYMREHESERCRRIERASKLTRGRLSPQTAEKLYGKRIRLSASKIDKFSSCHYAYFCQYGLNAKPYEPAGFRPPEIGSFMHYVLEQTAKDVKAKGGFKKVDNAELRAITNSYVEKYVNEELNDFQEKSKRFLYLFRRLCSDVCRVVEDMAEELRCSDFEPMDFELNFSGAGDLPPVELGEGEESLSVVGIADRVDGWLHDGKIYIRVVDYKTGKKEFSLSDVWYGMNLQMLMYLFSLEENGARRYGHEVVPAGVMYVPARSPIYAAAQNESDETIQSELGKQLRRSGLLLDDGAVLEAWEHGEEKRYIPIKMRYGKPVTDNIVKAEKLGILNRHVQSTLKNMAGQLRQGSIAADPFYRSQQENACLNCDYYELCHFSDGENGESCRRIGKELSAEKVWEMLEEGDNG